MSFLAILLLMNFFYSGSPTFMKLAVLELDPLQIVLLRHGLAFLAFLPFFLAQPEKRIARHDFFKIMLGSFLAFTFASSFQILGMQYSHAADGSFIMAMEPIIIITLAYFFLKEPLEPKMFAGLALALMGFITLSNHSLDANSFWSDRWVGNLLFLLATTAEASFPIFLKPLLKRYSPLTVAFYCLLCAVCYALPLQNLALWKNVWSLNGSTLTAILYLGLGCSFLACFLWLTSLKRTSATLVAISWFLQPLFGCLFAALLLKEAMSANIWMGGGFILAALALLTKNSKQISLAMQRPAQPVAVQPVQVRPVQTLVRIQHPLRGCIPEHSFLTWRNHDNPPRLGTIPPIAKQRRSQHRALQRRHHVAWAS